MADHEYSFSNSRELTAAQLRKLEPFAQAQIILGAHSYSGETFDDFEKVLAWLEEGGAGLEHRYIKRDDDKKPRYEMWIFASDNGMVFPVGSDEPTSVHCAQSHFWSVDDDDEDAIAMAESLNESVPF